MVSKKAVKEVVRIDGIKVHCCYDRIVHTRVLKPNPENPNVHSDEQIKKLAFVIKNNGWRSPITVSLRSGLIVKGHGRLEAAKYLKLKEVPVDYQNYDSENEELADLLADNRIAELANNDNKKLLALFEKCSAGDIDFEQTGFNEEEYKELASLFDEYEKKTDDNGESEQEETEPATKKVVICPGCGMQIRV